MVLVCNKPELADEVLHQLKWTASPLTLVRLARMHGKPHPESLVKLHENAQFLAAVRAIGSIGVKNQELPLANDTVANSGNA
jgi:beta-N-acetylhexosaminidase